MRWGWGGAPKGVVAGGGGGGGEDAVVEVNEVADGGVEVGLVAWAGRDREEEEDAENGGVAAKGAALLEAVGGEEEIALGVGLHFGDFFGDFDGAEDVQGSHEAAFGDGGGLDVAEAFGGVAERGVEDGGGGGEEDVGV